MVKRNERESQVKVKMPQIVRRYLGYFFIYKFCSFGYVSESILLMLHVLLFKHNSRQYDARYNYKGAYIGVK